MSRHRTDIETLYNLNIDDLVAPTSKRRNLDCVCYGSDFARALEVWPLNSPKTRNCVFALRVWKLEVVRGQISSSCGFEALWSPIMSSGE